MIQNCVSRGAYDATNGGIAHLILLVDEICLS